MVLIVHCGSTTTFCAVEGPISNFVNDDKLTGYTAEIHLLESARTLVENAPAAIKSRVCYEIALGYGQISHTKEAEALKECFGYARETGKSDSALGKVLQSQILDTLLSIDPTATAEVLPVADPFVKARVQSHLFDRRVASGDYSGALSQIEHLAHSPQFPYKAIATLLTNIPRDDQQDRRRIFLIALQSYRLEDPTKSPALEDLATLVVRFWRQLPPKLILQAIDEILAHAEKAISAHGREMLTLGTALGEAQFSSIYQYRLFELTPVLEHLNPGKAKAILKNNHNLETVLQKYPEGLPSLEPTYRATGLNSGEAPQVTITHRMSGNPAQSSTPETSDKATQEAAAIAAGALDDPDRALNKIEELTDVGIQQTGRSPKADALARIAATTMEAQPRISDEALKQLLKTVENYPLLSQSYYFVIAAGIYFRARERAKAELLIQKSMEAASSLYRTDMNSVNPNMAFKLDWPSAAAWRASVLLEDMIDGESAIALLNQINDPEIHGDIQVQLAGMRLGVPVRLNTARQHFKDGKDSVQTFAIPH
jgi:hypothetical protein